MSIAGAPSGPIAGYGTVEGLGIGKPSHEPPEAPPRSRLGRLWPWSIVVLGTLYFVTPLVGTVRMSLRHSKGPAAAWTLILGNEDMWPAFLQSIVNGLATIVVSLIVIVPTAYWVTLKMPRLRPIVEFITLLPFVIPGVVLVLALIRLYAAPPLLLTSTYNSTRVVMICAYAALSFPYMYRAVDNGLRAINVRSLTEAAQSLGAGWPTILGKVIFPNLRVALLSGALLTFAIVLGELTIALYMAQRTLAPFMADIVRNKPFEAAALTLIAFSVTWGALGMISFVTNRAGRKR
jgi:putative spermidine/putrescine transport system permease protein